jgi:hypothetical protein
MVAAKETKALREGANVMLIIDSLLKFNFFLSGEVQENLSLFGSVKHKQQCHCQPCRLRNTASIHRTVDWRGTWQTEHAAAFA